MKADCYAAPTLRGWRATDAGALALDLEGATAVVAIAEDGSVRLRARAGAELPPAPEPAIGREPWRPVCAEPRGRDGGGVWITHEGPRGEARVEIEPAPFTIRVLERAGGVVAVLDELGFADGGGARISYEARPAERFFGFGEKRGGLDKRGEHLRMRNRDPERDERDPGYLSIPFFLSLLPGEAVHRARGIMLEAFGPSRFDVAAQRADRVQLETEADGIDVTVFPGSRWSYASEAQVRALAEEIRTRRIPTDAIHLDIDYMDGYRVFSWHPKRFPDPERLTSELAEHGFRVVTIIDPGVKVDERWSVYRDGCERDVFCRRDDGEPFSLRVWPGESALPDFNREEVRSWWGEQHRALVEAGVAGIWNDMNEPAGWAREIRAGRAFVPIARQNVSRLVQSDPGDPDVRVPHEQVRNLYGYQECRATHGFLKRARPGRRPFLLTRSGYTGIQRFAAVWTGDNKSRWSHLRESIPMLLNLSVSGVAFCGADIGGFAFSCTPELYARWIQLGALYPFARTHSMWLKRRQEPWRFGARVEAIARAALELRMRLLPYLYGLFCEAEKTGTPVWRPLFLEFPDDPESAAVEDQLMLGPSLLVAPVVERGAREREVYLPPGRWMAWHDDAQYVGPRRLRVAAPLERLPLFVRAGSIVPMQSPVLHVGEAPQEPCILQVIPGADGAATLLEDDGESMAYRNGALARTPLRLWHRAGGRLRLELGRRQGSYRIPERPLRVVVRACPPPVGVYLNGARLEDGSALPGYAARGGRLHLRLADGGQGHSLEVDPAP